LFEVSRKASRHLCMGRAEAFEAELKLAPGRTALLVVDMQRAFLDPGEAMEVPAAREIVPQIQALLELFRSRGLPVVFTEFTYSEHVPVLVGLLHPEHQRAAAGAPRGFGRPSSSCLLGEANVHVVSELAPRPDELVVTKHYYDGFNGTTLDQALRVRGVTHLVLTGTMTDICVLATTIGGMNREYRMTVVEDATATLRPEIQRATLDIVGRAYARVLTTKQVAEEMGRW
jgi:nicotinamidase-related amidase